MVEELERRMKIRAELIRSLTGVDVAEMPRAGAAGGLGGAFHAYLGAELLSGIDAVLDVVGFDQEQVLADMVKRSRGAQDRV